MALFPQPQWKCITFFFAPRSPRVKMIMKTAAKLPFENKTQKKKLALHLKIVIYGVSRELNFY